MISVRIYEYIVKIKNTNRHPDGERYIIFSYLTLTFMISIICICYTLTIIGKIHVPS